MKNFKVTVKIEDITTKKKIFEGHVMEEDVLDNDFLINMMNMGFNEEKVVTQIFEHIEEE